MIKCASTLIISFLIFMPASGQNILPIYLPSPDTSDGMPLMQALKERQSNREISTDSLSLQVLSDMLWAACGINRPESGKRTAPSAMNWQEIDVYVASANGLFLYQPSKHILQPVLSDDIRAKTGAQPFVKDVPANLIYVADYSKVTARSDNDKIIYTAADAAFIAENVYLFCASEGLATVVRGSIDRESLAKAMKLRADQNIILSQSVGYPRK